MCTLKGRLSNSQKWVYVDLLFGHLWCSSQELAQLSLLAFTELVMDFSSSSFSIVIINVTSINISIVTINTPCTKIIDAVWKLIISVSMLYRITILIEMKDKLYEYPTSVWCVHTWSDGAHPGGSLILATL
jgi:hypothetical protein